MESLIHQAFMHIDKLGKQVAENQYDLIGPGGEIILPQVWETSIKPDMAISMHMWPEPKKEAPQQGHPGMRGPMDPREHHARMLMLQRAMQSQRKHNEKGGKDNKKGSSSSAMPSFPSMPPGMMFPNMPSGLAVPPPPPPGGALAGAEILDMTNLKKSSSKSKSKSKSSKSSSSGGFFGFGGSSSKPKSGTKKKK
jgi:hypothetical protein